MHNATHLNKTTGLQHGNANRSESGILYYNPLRKLHKLAARPMSYRAISSVSRRNRSGKAQAMRVSKTNHSLSDGFYAGDFAACPD
jgi:hypothetical protein